MNKITGLLIILLFASGNLCKGQAVEYPANSQPATSNIRGVQYPRVTTDLRAIFRIKAPDAQKVAVQVDKRYDMVKDDQGVWTVTTTPQVPGFHYYSLIIDGVSVVDPATETFYGMGRMASGIEIPEVGVDFYTLKDVPHGDVRSKWYLSKTTGLWRKINIYTPPGYDVNSKVRYPVLYLQHGSGEDERGWVVQGRVDIILDNLIAAGKAKPMLIVMEQGYASRPGEVPTPRPAPGTAPAAAGTPRPTGSSAFEEVVIKDLIPFIDATYRTLPDRDHRAMAGLSMGGGQTFQITMANLDKFSYIGGFSGSGRLAADADLKTVFNGSFADVNAFNKKVKLVWVGIGTAEPANMYTNVNGFHQALTKIGVNHVYYESPGTAHEWQTWRRSLNQFAPLLFQK